MMDDLGIDQSRTKKIITWEHDIQVPVPIRYWTNSCIQPVCKTSISEKEQWAFKLELEKSVKFASNLNSKPKTSKLYKSSLWKAWSLGDCKAWLNQSYTSAAKYAFICPHCQQWSLQRRMWTLQRRTIGLKLKDKVKPFCTKPYPIPLKNREVMERKLDGQSLIGALSRLTLEELKNVNGHSQLSACQR